MSDREGMQPKAPPSPSWITWAERIWLLLVVVSVFVVNVNGNRDFLQTEEQAGLAIGDTIAVVTPTALRADYDERAAHCSYSWGFRCETPAPPRKCELLSSDYWDCMSAEAARLAARNGRLNAGSGLFGMVSTSVSMFARLPDVTWYVFKKNYHAGWLPFGFVLLFVAINLVVASCAPLIMLPITLPICVAISSGLLALAERIFAFGGAAAAGIIGFVLFLAAVPHLIVSGFGLVMKTHEARELMHAVLELGKHAPDAGRETR